MQEKDESSGIYDGNKTVLLRNTRVNGRKSDIFISDSGIIEEISEKYSGKSGEPEFIVDAENTVASPGFANTHTHAAMTLLRGYADDMHLQQWLSEKIWPLEAHLKAEDVYWGTKLACTEMIRSGTVAFNDMYFFMESAAKAVEESGIKAVLSYGFIDFGDSDKRESEIKATENLYQNIRKMDNPRIKAAAGPHAPYTVSKEGLKWCAEFSKEKDIMLHIHLSETENEVKECIEKNGVRPAKLLDECGCLGEKTVAAHCCWLDDAECELLGKRHVSASHNPVSNMKLAVNRAMPYQKLLDSGANVALGTDGCSSNNNLDILEEMKTAAILQKFFWNSDTVLPAHEAVKMATEAGKKALGFGDGILKEGAQADIVLLKTNIPCMTPLFSQDSNTVYSCSSNAVDTVICNGRVLMHDGFIPGEEEICKKASETAENLVKRYKDSL
ncbi:5-methylthioadenosine/S-adenosylhomocysteine deaminase [Methanomicrobium sp. W14]|uniref:amidohydrolase family protein n=1 Tax=Methanomicrobium sp. W14 TaxID=2817839 RepID=UPI001AE92023|nr:amidohydrolase family protein [Methanomicrobium sp. W14]MBP2132152.1 5-methylthioadenosine/S-adenosylhomocysteine deaminase [Methanomicrobium sp. W14]